MAMPKYGIVDGKIVVEGGGVKFEAPISDAPTATEPTITINKKTYISSRGRGGGGGGSSSSKIAREKAAREKAAREKAAREKLEAEKRRILEAQIKAAKTQEEKQIGTNL